MYPHQQAAVERVIKHFSAQPEVLAVLLAGSIAHGFASEASDVDILIIVSDEVYQKKLEGQQTAFFDIEMAGYPGGYIDGKYLSPKFLDRVAEIGSEPARFAFADAQILFSYMDDLEQRLARVTRYPVENKLNRIQRFCAQLEAWHWYTGEAAKKQDPYLMTTAAGKLMLFGGRILLAHNELLYPYHKWFLAVLEGATEKPEGIVDLMRSLGKEPNQTAADQFYALVKNFRAWEVGDVSWPNWFMDDTELRWMNNSASIEDL